MVLNASRKYRSITGKTGQASRRRGHAYCDRCEMWRSLRCKSCKIFVEWSLYLPIFFLFYWGRGLKSGENFKLLYDLADQLHAAGKVVFLSRKMFPFDWRSFFFIFSFICVTQGWKLFYFFQFLSFPQIVFLSLQVNGIAFSEEWASSVFFIIYATLNLPNLSSFFHF